MIIYTGCDHAGLELKKQLMSVLPDVQWKDLGTFTADSVDYPDFANLVCKEVSRAEIQNKSKGIEDALQGESLGLLICGSGQGMVMRANRFPEIRAALCWTEEVAQVSRQHNNANVLCLGQRFIKFDEALKILRVFLSTPFEGGRHSLRVGKISAATDC